MSTFNFKLHTMKVRSLFGLFLSGVVPLVAQDAPLQPSRAQAALRAEPLNPRTTTIAPIPQAAPRVASPAVATPVEAPRPSAAPAPGAKKPDAAEGDQPIKPSWETQKLARTYAFTIPAPRGLITDRNGVPLAQTRIGHNLAIQFPTPPEFNDTQAQRYIADQVALARQILRRDVQVDVEAALRHYKARGIMPYHLPGAQDLKPAEVEAFNRARPPGLTIQRIYLRYYPQGQSAAHIIGYVGRQGAYPSGTVENNEMLWPDFEGREGLEKTFNQQLTGKPGVMHVTFDAQGH